MSDLLALHIVCEPAECWAGCEDHGCPYSHFDTWRCPDGSQHFTKRDAETYAASLRAIHQGRSK